MKSLAGFITGVIATVLVLTVIHAANKSDVEILKSDEKLPGLIIFPQKGECITKNDLEIFQIIKPNMALAQFGKFTNETLVLLVNYEGKTYYDKQKIQVPSKKCA